jgi:hypothetical protein
LPTTDGGIDQNNLSVQQVKGGCGGKIYSRMYLDGIEKARLRAARLARRQRMAQLARASRAMAARFREPFGRPAPFRKPPCCAAISLSGRTEQRLSPAFGDAGRQPAYCLRDVTTRSEILSLSLIAAMRGSGGGALFAPEMWPEAKIARFQAAVDDCAVAKRVAETP